MLRKSISKYLELFKDYTELRIQENRESAIVLLNGDVAHNIKKVTGGLSARAFNSGSWGFSSSPNLSEDEVRLAVTEANQNAQFLKNKSSKKHPGLDKIVSQGNYDYFTKKIKRSQKELIEFLAELDHYLVKNCPEVKSRKVILKLLDMEKNLLTSDNSWAHSMTPRANIYIFLSGVCDDGSALELYEVLGQLGEFEDVFNSPVELYPTIDKLYQHFLNKKSAVFADAGVKEVILDADLAGILAHEAIGHTVEADIVLGGSVAGDYLGQSVASPLITLVDYAHSEGGRRCPVPVHVDDEGTLAQDVVIIKDGI
ncbi:MAG: metallopeptidase TldD-related protein, partial [Bdellovibrionota bacterium]